MNGFTIIPLEIPTKTNTEAFLSGSRPSVAAEKKPKNRLLPVSARMTALREIVPRRIDTSTDTIDAAKRKEATEHFDRLFTKSISGTITAA